MNATLAQALAERRCNGCGLPAREWGPVCGGMTIGDYTHYHSPEWWRRYLPEESPRHGSLPPVPVAETPPDDPWLALASGPLTVDVCDCDAGCDCDREEPE